MVTMPRAWGHAVGIVAMPNIWRPCQRHGNNAKGMATMPTVPKARHGGLAKGLETIPTRQGMEIMPKACGLTMMKTWKPCSKHSDQDNEKRRERDKKTRKGKKKTKLF